MSDDSSSEEWDLESPTHDAFDHLNASNAIDAEEELATAAQVTIISFI